MKRRQSIKFMGAAVAVGLMLGPAVASSQAQQAGGGGGTAQMNTLAQTGQLKSKDYDFLVKAAGRAGIEIRYRTGLRKLLQEKSGAVSGVLAFGPDGYEEIRARAGNSRWLTSRSGTIR